jgi:hypothetical protein
MVSCKSQPLVFSWFSLHLRVTTKGTIKELEHTVICEFRGIAIHLQVLKVSVNKPLKVFKSEQSTKVTGAANHCLTTTTTTTTTTTG